MMPAIRTFLPHALRAAALGCVLLAAAAQAAVTVETRPMTLAGEATQVDLYVSSDGASHGLAVIAHGFTRSRERHVGLARRLAAEGFVVAVPDLPHWLRHRHNADAIVDLVGALGQAPELAALPVVLIGTSAGGLESLLASERVPRLALWVGLDPVDSQGISEPVARKLRAPAVVLRAPSAPCNAFGSAKKIAAWLPNRRAEERLEGTSHCDFEDSTDWRCEVLCGAADPARQARIVDEAVKAVRAAVEH